MELLRRVLADPRLAGWRIGNVDLTIVAQRPKLLPYRLQMIRNLAAALNARPGTVSVKATTTEHLGFEGREEGIRAECVLLLTRD